jgi:putative transport protein
LVVAILLGRFGYKFKLATYMTVSANLMIREMGIALFLAGVGLGAGDGFVETVIHGGGYVWVFYGMAITLIPMSLAGILGRAFFKFDYFTLIGVMSGSCTNPPALAYSNSTTHNDRPAVGYSTVYPLTMFMRVLTAQLLIIFFAA